MHAISNFCVVEKSMGVRKTKTENGYYTWHITRSVNHQTDAEDHIGRIFCHTGSETSTNRPTLMLTI